MQLYNGYYASYIILYKENFYNNTKVYIHVHNNCHVPTTTRDKEERVRLIYVFKDIMSRQQQSTSGLIYESVKYQ